MKPSGWHLLHFPTSRMAPNFPDQRLLQLSQTYCLGIFCKQSFSSAITSPAHVCRSVHPVPLFSWQRGCQQQQDSSPLQAELHHELPASGLSPLFVSTPPPFCPPPLFHLPTFTCFSALISQVYLCIEQEIFCCDMAVKFSQGRDLSGCHYSDATYI